MIYIYLAFILPIILMSVYIYYLLGVKKLENITYEDADLAYYGGFALTIFILITSLSSVSEFKIEQILGKFSAGIFATLIGLGARLYLIHKINSGVKPTPDDIEKTISRLVTEMQQFTYIMHEKFGSTSRYVEKIDLSFESLSKEILQLIESLSSSMEKLSFSGNLDNFQKSFDGSLMIVETSLNKFKSDIASLPKELDATYASVEKFNASINSLSSMIVRLENLLTQNNNVISETFQSYSNNTLEVNVFTESIKSSSSSLSKLNKSIERFDKLSQELESLAMSKIDKSIERFDKLSQELESLKMVVTAYKTIEESMSKHTQILINMQKAQEESNVILKKIVDNIQKNNTSSLASRIKSIWK